MLAKQILRAVRWTPHVFVVFSAVAFALVVWPPKTELKEWRPSTRIPVGFVDMHPGTLAWKQPILPAQFAEGGCGVCHHEDLPETPRLNRGR